jgi:hypothetical protein
MNCMISLLPDPHPDQQEARSLSDCTRGTARTPDPYSYPKWAVVLTAAVAVGSEPEAVLQTGYRLERSAAAGKYESWNGHIVGCYAGQ